MKRSVLLVALVTLAACSYQPPTTSTPSTLTPTLTLTPASVNVNAGNPAVFFSANVRNSTETVIWTYSGPGKVTPSGMGASYTPPTKIKATEGGTLTATLGSTGVTATAPIVIYPANVTPPAEPPPTKPNPPTTPPTDPNPPTKPDPAEPQITVKASPGGPVPWAVRYEVSVTSIPGYNDDAPVFFDYTCGNEFGSFPTSGVTAERSDAFVCFHTDLDDEITVQVSGVDGNVLLEKKVKAKVKASTGVAFKGKWRYGWGDDTYETTLDAGSPTSGAPHDPEGENPNNAFYGVQYNFESRGPEIYVQAATYSDPVVPDPLPDGTQRYVPPPNLEGGWSMEKLN